jgi:hypothetical protein
MNRGKKYAYIQKGSGTGKKTYNNGSNVHHKKNQ